MTAKDTEALVAKAVIVAAWFLFALSIGVGVQGGVDAEKQSRLEPAQAVRQS